MAHASVPRAAAAACSAPNASAAQVLFLIALFTALASAVLRDQPPPALRAALTPVLAALCAATFLVAILSGGLRSRPAHAHLQPALHDEPPAARRPPDSIVSHALGPDGLLATLRRELAGRRSGDEALCRERSVQRTYEVDTFASGDLDAAAALLRRRSGDSADSGALSARSSTSIASELYHEQPAADVPPHAAVRTPAFWLLVFCCFVTMGAALGLLDNLDQIVGSLAPHSGGAGDAGAAREALRAHAEYGQALLICFSVSNLCGRVAAGYLSECALHAWVRPRLPPAILPGPDVARAVQQPEELGLLPTSVRPAGPRANVCLHRRRRRNAPVARAPRRGRAAGAHAAGAGAAAARNGGGRGDLWRGMDAHVRDHIRVLRAHSLCQQLRRRAARAHARDVRVPHAGGAAVRPRGTLAAPRRGARRRRVQR